MLEEGHISFQRFREKSFLNQYFPTAIRIQKLAEFESLTQAPGVTVVEYASQFHTLGTYSPTIMADEAMKMHLFKKGLTVEFNLLLLLLSQPFLI